MISTRMHTSRDSLRLVGAPTPPGRQRSSATGHGSLRAPDMVQCSYPKSQDQVMSKYVNSDSDRMAHSSVLHD